MQRIVEITKEGAFLSVERGFLNVEIEKQLSQIPLDAIEALLLATQGATITTTLLSRLCDLGIPVVVCRDNYMPTGLLLQYEGFSMIPQRLTLQIEASLPLKKNIWKQIVSHKVANQKDVLFWAKRDCSDFDQLISHIGSGDPQNVEAQAARKYWPRLFGDSFLRDTSSKNINGALNYAYAIIRAMVARKIVASGLNPALGIMHQSQRNAFCLVDDLMEPFRPCADYAVAFYFQEMNLLPQQEFILSPAFKKWLIASLNMITLMTVEGGSHLSRSMELYVNDYVTSLQNKKEGLCCAELKVALNKLTNPC